MQFWVVQGYSRDAWLADVREVKQDVNGTGRQTAKVTYDFEFFSSNP